MKIVVPVLDDVDACAVGLAGRIAPWRPDVRVTAVTMGPSDAADMLRAALVLGAEEGVHVLDERLNGSDALATSRVLAAAVARRGSTPAPRSDSLRRNR